MKYLKWAGSHLRDACIYFTVFQFVVAALFQLTAESGGKGEFLIFSVEIAVFVFSFVLAAAADIFRIKNVSLGIKLLLHFLCCLAAVYILFRIISRNMFKANSFLYVMVGFAFLYVVGALIAVLVIRLVKKKKSDEAEYESQFNSQGKGKKK